MSEKHTPGPWEINREWMDGEWRQVVSGWDEKWLRLSVAGNIGEANARLIAAAPELLEALEKALPDLSGQDLLRARAAIAKATGQDAQT